MIGKENLIVRRFDVESWRDGSIIHDFMHEIGIDVTPEFHELEKMQIYLWTRIQRRSREY